ncbi:MAG: hypothetical protein ABI699_06365 [Caldimonas sp.]
MNHRLALAVALSAALASPLALAQVQPGPVPAAAMPLEQLRVAYLSCERAPERTRADARTYAHCASVGYELLERGFEGDIERLLDWRRSELAKGAAGQRLSAAGQP